jgi:outer membrane protein OmpA-like peptidoglycan-associated protein
LLLLFFLVGWWMGGPVALGQSGAGNGLWGEYFNGPDFNTRVTGRLDPWMQFSWPRHCPEGVDHEYFTVRWTGKLYVPQTGTYTFLATVDDGIRLWLDGQQLMNEWRRQASRTYSAEVELEGNTYHDLRIEYYNDWLLGHLKLEWKAPENATGVLGFFGYAPPQPIPRKYLFGKKPATVPVPAPPATPVAVAAKPSEPGPDTPRRKPDGKTAARKTNPKPAVVSTPDPAAGNAEEASFDRLEAGRPVVLNKVFFGQGQYALLPASYPELDRLAAALRENPAVRIEIRGHTDNVGDPRLNLALSEHRAQVVANYLMRKGVAEGRIAHRGFGGTQPVRGNDTEADREQNRRVEFVVQEK